MKMKQNVLLVWSTLSIFLFSSQGISQPTTSGLVAYFDLNGNTINAGPATITASPVNTSYSTNSLNTPNTAMQFGGTTSSYLDFVDNGHLDFSGSTNFTVSFFFFFNGNTTSGLIDNCLNYNGWGVWLWSTVANTWNLQFNYRNNSVGSAAATAFTLNAWHHVAAVRNNGTISLYIDGAFRLSASEGTQTPTYPINMNAGVMTFGSLTPPRYNPFGGKLDEIRIYNRALSAGEIAVLANAVALPLKLGNFTAVKKSNSTLLNWETIGEQNSSHFEIEKSTDGGFWEQIGIVRAAINSNSRIFYEFLDPVVNQQLVYYRLKMLDIDGAFSYSKVIAVKPGTPAATISIYPNPVQHSLNIQLKSTGKQEAGITILDAAGKRLLQQQWTLQEGLNNNSLPVNNFAAGTYWLIIATGNNSIKQQFIKN